MVSSMAKKKAPTRKPASAKRAEKGSAKSKSAGQTKRTARRTPSKAKSVSLGRPKVTAEEKLYMLFKDDYQARQLFEFLQVSSVGELEHFTPAEIVERLSQPVRQTVQRIRKLLAEKNRSLREDQEFAAKQKN